VQGRGLAPAEKKNIINVREEENKNFALYLINLEGVNDVYQPS
jgi:hypothetical protein